MLGNETLLKPEKRYQPTQTTDAFPGLPSAGFGLYTPLRFTEEVLR